MKIDLSPVSALKQKTPALVIGCHEDFKNELFSQCDAVLDGCLGRLATTREFSGKVNTTCLLHTIGKLPAERLLLVGLGKKAMLDDELLRQAAGSAVQALRGARVASFTSALVQTGANDAALEAVCEGSLLGSYSFNQYRTKDREKLFRFDAMTLLLPKGISTRDAGSRIERTQALCRAVDLARDLVSHPGNVATTGYLAGAARELASRHSLSCRILEVDELRQQG